jgi:hypothetical protein
VARSRALDTREKRTRRDGLISLEIGYRREVANAAAAPGTFPVRRCVLALDERRGRARVNDDAGGVREMRY